MSSSSAAATRLGAVIALAASMVTAGAPTGEADISAKRMAEYLEASQQRRAKMAAARQGMIKRGAGNFTHEDYWSSGLSKMLRDGQREFFPVLERHPEALQRVEELLAGAGAAGEARGSLRVLQIGAGVSPLAEELLGRGFAGLVSTDVSPTAVQRLRESAKHLGGSYAVADATDLRDFPAGSFDVVVEKGALDALTSDPVGQTERAIAEFVRVLVPGGSLCSITGIGEDGEGSPKLLSLIRAAFPAVEVTRLRVLPGEPRPAHVLHAHAPVEMRV